MVLRVFQIIFAEIPNMMASTMLVTAAVTIVLLKEVVCTTICTAFKDEDSMLTFLLTLRWYVSSHCVSLLNFQVSFNTLERRAIQEGH